ncbi:MAG TPA: transposase [Ktedonobacterales bacterium]
MSAGTFPADVPNRVRYGPRLRALAVYLVERQLVPYGHVRDLFGDLLGAEISVGTMVEWVQQAANALEPVEARIKAALSQAPVLHSDETGVRQAGHLVWAHVASFYCIEWPIFQYRSQAGGTQETKEFRTVGDELFRIVRFLRTRHTWRCVTLIGIAGGGTAAPTLRGAHAERISHLQMIPDARFITTVSDNLLALA